MRSHWGLSKLFTEVSPDQAERRMHPVRRYVDVAFKKGVLVVSQSLDCMVPDLIRQKPVSYPASALLRKRSEKPGMNPTPASPREGRLWRRPRHQGSKLRAHGSGSLDRKDI